MAYSLLNFQVYPFMCEEMEGNVCVGDVLSCMRQCWEMERGAAEGNAGACVQRVWQMKGKRVMAQEGALIHSSISR